MPAGLSPSVLLLIVAALVLAGIAIGFLAGLFGVGGGAISVPVFYEVFRFTGNADDIAMPLAVGTSLAMIIPTAFVSAREHARRGSLNTGVLRSWILPVLSGVIAGTAIASVADARVFQTVFMLVAGVLALRMLLGGAGWQIADTLPGRGLLSLYGAFIGLLSALMGIGGGALSTMMLTLHGRPIHEAVSTSAGLGLLIAIPGTLGYIIVGWHKPGLPPDALGYVSLLALFITLPAALTMTRHGVQAAHARSRTQLSRLFGLFLLMVTFRFVVAVLSGI
ncbi:sulfite exporter TauE/SafE family protein [Granulosicoccus sp. 3-233]